MMLRAALPAVLVTIGGCLGAGTDECPGGGVCPAGTVCRLDHETQVCALESCGNGALEAGEDCDDGNHETGDGCTGTCRIDVRPSKRAGLAMAYDGARGRLVVFGGWGDTMLDDTWEWGADGWSERHPSPIPPARYRAAVTYDSNRRRIVLFGGFDDAQQPLGDLWEWDGDRWTQRTTTGPSPSPRGGASMTYDWVRGVSVLFGGRDVNSPSDNSVWEWNGDTWETRSPPLAPLARAGAAMAFDERWREAMLVGGTVDDRSTWFWNGTRWAILGGVDTPTFYEAPGLAYDYDRATTVLFGGRSLGRPDEYGALYELTRAGWVERGSEPAPAPRESFGMAYSFSNQVVVFGGDGSWNGAPSHYNDLWMWDGVSWRELF